MAALPVPSVFSAVQAGQQIAGDSMANPGGLSNAVLQFQQAKAARDAAASAIPVAPDHPSGAVDDFAQHLLDHSLNDAGVPNNQAAMPDASGAAAPAAAPAGGAIPVPGAPAQAQASPAQSGKPHSLGPDFWAANNERIMAATRAAAQAGHDAQATYTALTNVRNGFFQSNVLKNLSAAQQALMAGDSKGVEQAMKNVYYYFPDGNELQIKHGANGEVLYQDPLQPKDANGKDNFVPITPQHLQMIAMNAMDPMKVSDMITTTHAAALKQRLEQQKADSETTTAGAAALNAKSNAVMAPGRSYQAIATGTNEEARAKWFNARTAALATQAAEGTPLKPNEAVKLGGAASLAVDNLAQGQPTTVPAMVTTTNAKGQTIQTPNISPAAGRTTRDPAKIPAALKNIAPEKLANVRALAQTIAIANAGGVGSEDAANIAVAMITGGNSVHKGPDGKAEADVKIDRASNTGWLFNNATGTWRSFRLTPRVASSLASGTSLMDDSADDESSPSDVGGFDAGHDYNNDPASRAPAQ